MDLAREGRTEQLTALLDQGLPVNVIGESGDSLLMLAAYYTHPETVDVLLARGANPSELNDRGQTVLSAAVFRRSERMVRALLAAGADPRQGSPSAIDVIEMIDVGKEITALLTDS